MSLFVLFFSVVVVTLVMALMFVMPALVRAELPLGVSVPQGRVGEPVVHTSIRRYRIGVVSSWVLGVVLTLVLFASFPVAASIVPVLIAIALGLLAYVLSRRMIIRAKQDGRWYENVSVRLRAEITAESAPARLPFGWVMGAGVILLVVVAVGVALYPSIPDPTPIHWDAAGQPDNYAPKSVWSAFGPVLIGFGVVAVLYATSFLVRVSPLRAVPSDSPAESRRRIALQHRLTTSLLGQVAVVLAAQTGWLAVAGWVLPAGGWGIATSAIVMLALLLAVLVVFVVRYRNAVASWSTASGEGRPDAPDDDRYWKGGFVYINRNDPSVFVPKRFGVGWTVNLGSIGGTAIGIVLLAVIAGAIVMAIVAPGTAHPS
jgi:uncharacterized membrane protein